MARKPVEKPRGLSKLHAPVILKSKLTVIRSNLGTKYSRLKRKEHTLTRNNNNNSRHGNKNILKQLEKSKRKGRSKGDNLGEIFAI